MNSGTRTIRPHPGETIGIKARWIFPVAAEPIRDGVIWIEGGRIVSIQSSGPRQGASDLGNVAILPGLINAHTHLELSGFGKPLGHPGISLVDWIGLVVQARATEAYDLTAAVARGLDESLAAGVAAVGDIVQSPLVVPNEGQSLSAQIATMALLELIGPTPERAADALDRAIQYLEAGQGGGGSRIGLSPHAPYSIRPELLDGACRLSAQHGVPVALHLAESPEEMQLLRHGDGPFRNLLEQRDAWDATVQRPGRRPLEFLEALAAADRALAIHGNYLDTEEIAFLAKRRRRMSVVYCPRTHAWFGHQPYPLRAMLGAGVNVALGTDSRASAPDLDLLSEMRTVAARHPDVSGERIVHMGTLAGAQALGIHSHFGTIEPGRTAHLAAVDLPARHSADPYDLLLRAT